MEARRVYVAEWIERLIDRGPDHDFDPYADVVYAKSEHATFEDAKRVALANEGGYGYASVWTDTISRSGRRTQETRESVL